MTEMRRLEIDKLQDMQDFNLDCHHIRLIKKKLL